MTIQVGDKVQLGYLYDRCPQNYKEGVVIWVHPYNFYPNGKIDSVVENVQLEVLCDKESTTVDSGSISFDKDIYIGMTHQEIQEERDMNLIKAIAQSVRYKMVESYGTDTELFGHCIEASDLIVERLKNVGIEAVATEGWCWYDDDYSCTDMPGDPHTWVEVPKYDLYVDVTADQFNLYMFDEYPDVVIHKGLPNGMSYEKPSWDLEIEEKEDEIECEL